MSMTHRSLNKIVASFAGLAMMSSFAACSGGSSSEETDDTTAENAHQTQQEQDNAAMSGDGSTLVVYYSATGNTERVARYIADSTGGDLFELEPVEPYTDDDLNWTDENSRVNREHENESQRDVELVADTADNWDDYSTVFIGYPIWWGIAA